MGFNINEKPIIKKFPFSDVQNNINYLTNKFNEKYNTTFTSPIIDDKWLMLFLKRIGINTVMTESAMLLRGIATRDISMLDIYELMTNDKEAYEILTQNDPVNNDMTPLEIVEKKEEAFTKLEGIIYKNKLEPFYTLLKAGSGIRLAQLVDTMCFIGCNPDWDVMIPHVVADSWLRGIGASNQDPKGAFYVTQLAARIAKKLEKCDIAITGWVLKQQMFIMKNTRVSEVEAGGNEYKILLASVTYFKLRIGDQVTIVVPEDNIDATWAAVEASF
jgi:hypothetical protein